MFLTRGTLTKDHYGLAATSAGLTLQTSLDNQGILCRAAARGQTPLTATSRRGMKEAEETKVERGDLLTTTKLTALKEDITWCTASKPRAALRKQYADNKNGSEDSRRQIAFATCQRSIILSSQKAAECHQKYVKIYCLMILGFSKMTKQLLLGEPRGSLCRCPILERITTIGCHIRLHTSVIIHNLTMATFFETCRSTGLTEHLRMYFTKITRPIVKCFKRGRIAVCTKVHLVMILDFTRILGGQGRKQIEANYPNTQFRKTPPIADIPQ